MGAGELIVSAMVDEELGEAEAGVVCREVLTDRPRPADLEGSN